MPPEAQSAILPSFLSAHRFRESLELNRQLHGNEHVATGSSVYNLGLTLQARGMFKESEPFLPPLQPAAEQCD